MNRYLYAGVLEELEEAQREKYEMDALVAQYGAMTALGLQGAGALYQE